MRTKDIEVGAHYAYTRWPRSSYLGRRTRVLVLETAVEREVGAYTYTKTTRRDGVRVRFLRDNGRRMGAGGEMVVPAENIVHTWETHLEEERQAQIAAEESERQEMQHETLLAYAKGRLAVLGIKEGFEDEDYREDWHSGDGDYVSFHPKALIALLDKLDHAPSFTPTKRKDKLYVNGLVIAEDNGNGHFEHIYNALKGVAKHGTP